MWQELSVVHGKPRGEAGTPLVWRTCLRQIAFLSPGARPPPAAEEQIFRGLHAHRFLLEVCAGLHSPLLGETEVFGQFKAFKEAQQWHPAWLPLLEAVEEDVKKLRRNFLKDLGAQSYGSLARKRVPQGEPVVLVGSGRLAKDLLPWLDKNPVTLLVRNPEKKEGWWDKTRVVPLAEAERLAAGQHWLIAAPLANEALLGLWQKKRPGTVLDFRGEEKFDRCPAETYFDLPSLFGELEAVRSELAVRRNAALEAAARYSRQREATVCHRPFGWEDAFA